MGRLLLRLMRDAWIAVVIIRVVMAGGLAIYRFQGSIRSGALRFT